jgi:hypothetical protein
VFKKRVKYTKTYEMDDYYKLEEDYNSQKSSSSNSSIDNIQIGFGNLNLGGESSFSTSEFNNSQQYWKEILSTIKEREEQSFSLEEDKVVYGEGSVQHFRTITLTFFIPLLGKIVYEERICVKGHPSQMMIGETSNEFLSLQSFQFMNENYPFFLDRERVENFQRNIISWNEELKKSIAKKTYQIGPGIKKFPIENDCSIEIKVIGGGGAGGGGWTQTNCNQTAVGGGGGGGYTKVNVFLKGGQVLTINVGKGGIATNGNGGDGGDSFVTMENGNQIAFAGGGKGGKCYGNGAGGNEGNGNNYNGENGSNGMTYSQFISQNCSSYCGSIGSGGSVINGGAGGLGGWNSKGTQGSNPGGGGGGGTGSYGSSGGDGQVIFKFE